MSFAEQRGDRRTQEVDPEIGGRGAIRFEQAPGDRRELTIPRVLAVECWRDVTLAGRVRTRSGGAGSGSIGFCQGSRLSGAPDVLVRDSFRARIGRRGIGGTQQDEPCASEENGDESQESERLRLHGSQ